MVISKTNSSLNTEWDDAQGASWYIILFQGNKIWPKLNRMKSRLANKTKHDKKKIFLQGVTYNTTLSNWNFNALEQGTVYSVNVTAYNDAGTSLTIISMIETCKYCLFFSINNI